MMLIRRLFAFMASFAASKPRYIHPMDPRDERVLNLLRQRRELRDRAAADAAAQAIEDGAPS
jgi:hypothetical protein